ncbi:MAG: Hpt domain-containing protein [Acidobacteria bacterium]|nr:Hpt domain-containing protein [Acidobacteriota bacterium]
MSLAMTQSPVDVAEGLARAGQDREFFKELLEMLSEDAPAKLADIRALLAASRPGDVAAPAHSLKGAAANLSAVGVMSVAKQIEDAARKGVHGELSLLADQLEREIDRLLAFTRDFEP